jgi:hypothetical protein
MQQTAAWVDELFAALGSRHQFLEDPDHLVLLDGLHCDGRIAFPWSALPSFMRGILSDEKHRGLKELGSMFSSGAPVFIGYEDTHTIFVKIKQDARASCLNG